MKEKGNVEEKALKYLSYLSLVIGLSLLGAVFIYYIIVLSASVGILLDNYVLYSYVQKTTEIEIPSLYCNMFFMLFSFGSLGSILTYIGSVIIPRIIKEYL
jgi:hypothetical protein